MRASVTGAIPMDGGRVLRASLALRMDHALATQRAAQVGQFLAVGLGLLGVAYNPMLVLIAAFIWFGASMENSVEQRKSVLDRGECVGMLDLENIMELIRIQKAVEQHRVQERR